MLQKLAWVFAVVFIAIGVLGFVPGITADGNLFGMFEVSTTHNIIHLITGLVAAGAAMIAKSRLFFQVAGVVYALIAIVGFISGDTVAGIMGVNMADNILYLVVALVALYAGFVMKENGDMPSDMPQQPQEPPQQRM